MKELTIEEVSHKAIQSARLWLMGYMTTAEPHDPNSFWCHDEWNHSDGWDLNLYHLGNQVRISAYPVVDDETDYDRWVCVAEGTIPSQDKDTNVVPQEHCERCGEETPNGAGHFQDELGTEERLCGECYKKEKSERMGINNWAFAFTDLVGQILGK